MECPEFLPLGGDARDARPRKGFTSRLLESPGASYALLTLALVCLYAVELSLVVGFSPLEDKVRTGALFSNVGLGMVPFSLAVAVSAALSVFSGVGRRWKWVVAGTFTIALFQLLASWTVVFEGAPAIGALSLLAAALTFAYGDIGESARAAEGGGEEPRSPYVLRLCLKRWRAFGCLAIGTLAFRFILGL